MADPNRPTLCYFSTFLADRTATGTVLLTLILALSNLTNSIIILSSFLA